MSIDWDSYQQCPVCGSGIGEPCRSLSGVAEGIVVKPIDHPHGGRKLRAGR